MAVRRNAEMPEMPVTQEDIRRAFESFDASEANPMPLKEIATLVADTPDAVWDVLNVMEEEGKADLTGRHLNSLWWPLSASEKSKTVTPKVAPKPAAPTAAEKNKTAAKRVAKKSVAKPVEQETDRFGFTPDQAGFGASEAELDNMEADGVDPSESQTGLSRAQVAKDVTTVKVERLEQTEEVTKPAPHDVREGLETFYVQALRAREEATNVRDGYEAPEEVTTLPERPYGVNENVWNAAYNAFGVSPRDTLSARLFYINRALEQHTEAIAA